MAQVNQVMFSQWDKYIATYYWGFTILTTVGFGDISGTSTLERCALIVSMLVGSLGFGVFIGKIGSVIQGQSMGRIEYSAR